MGYTSQQLAIPSNSNDPRIRIKKIDALKDHPNYLLPTPLKGETQIQFTLRCASHLVSPPQEPNESYDVECTVIRDGILALENDIAERWNKANH